MKKIKIFLLSFIIIMSLSSSTFGKESVISISEVLLYCNKKEFIKDMVVNAYKMQLAASGLVHDEKHKHLASTEMWINTRKGQWAIVFVYKDQDKSCILGGNNIDLHTP
tara:strand:+ start:2509 stop:2835 length:327 start_codon:yes stop_codon:yes gene_type:complete